MGYYCSEYYNHLDFFVINEIFTLLWYYFINCDIWNDYIFTRIMKTRRPNNFMFTFDLDVNAQFYKYLFLPLIKIYASNYVELSYFSKCLYILHLWIYQFKGMRSFGKHGEIERGFQSAWLYSYRLSLQSRIRKSVFFFSITTIE